MKKKMPIFKSAIFAGTAAAMSHKNKHMKKTLFFIYTVLAFSLASFAQSGVIPAVDKSPMDMSYYPVNYPVLKIQDKVTEPLTARVIYSRPRKEGRVIFGGLVEYGKLWRLGANEATEIEFFKPVRINGKRIHKGRYTLFAIASENTWTIIVNSDTDTWGQFKYDIKKDVVRIDVPVEKTTESVEYFGMAFEKSATGISLLIAWDMVKVAIPVSLK